MAPMIMLKLRTRLTAVVLSALSGGPALYAMEPEEQEDLFRATIEQLESSEGAYAPALPEQLLSLGLNLQQSGRHEEAVDLFRRGVHLARINNGLYDAEQIPLLEREIASYLALGRYNEADERQQYLYKVQMRNLQSGTDRAEALMQQARWQYNAYLLALNGNDYNRLMNMWDLYRLALNDIVAREGETSPTLLRPLDGMLLSQYLIAGYQFDSQTSNFNSSDNLASQQSANRFHAYRAQSYTKGRAVIQAIYDIHKANSGENTPQTAGTLISMGDWCLWNKERDVALQFYREAIAELVAGGAAQEDADSLFADPVAMPNYGGLSSLPEAPAGGEGLLHLEFTVNADGKVRDLQRLDENELSSGLVNRIMRRLKKVRFRPALAMGEPVITEKVSRYYEVE